MVSPLAPPLLFEEKSGPNGVADNRHQFGPYHLKQYGPKTTFSKNALIPDKQCAKHDQVDANRNRKKVLHEIMRCMHRVVEPLVK